MTWEALVAERKFDPDLPNQAPGSKSGIRTIHSRKGLRNFSSESAFIGKGTGEQMFDALIVETEQQIGGIKRRFFQPKDYAL